MKITVKKGLNINIKGASEKVMGEANPSEHFAIKPTDFPTLVPKMLVKEGDSVKCGSPIFCDKYNDQINFSSPASGKVQKIIRGEKRRILAVTMLSDDKFTQLNSTPKDYSKLGREEFKSDLLTMSTNLNKSSFNTNPRFVLIHFIFKTFYSFYSFKG